MNQQQSNLDDGLTRGSLKGRRLSAWCFGASVIAAASLLLHSVLIIWGWVARCGDLSGAMGGQSGGDGQ